MVEQALDAGVMRFDTCARGREAVLPSVLLAAIGGAGGDQASDEGAVIAQSCSILTQAAHACHVAFACAQFHPGFHVAFCTDVIERHIVAGHGYRGALGVAQPPRRRLNDRQRTSVRALRYSPSGQVSSPARQAESDRVIELHGSQRWFFLVIGPASQNQAAALGRA